MVGTFGKTIMKDPKGFLTIDQIRRLLDMALKTNVRDYMLLLTMFKTGRRVSEALLLKRGDIDFENKRIVFTVLKRRIPIKRWFEVDREVIVALKKYCEVYRIIEADDILFPITRQRVFQLFRKYCKAVNIEWIGEKKPHPHHLRHSFAVQFIQAGNTQIEDLKVLQEYLGHASIDSTSCYLQFDKDLYRKKLERIPKVILNPTKLSGEHTDNEVKDKKADKPDPIVT